MTAPLLSPPACPHLDDLPSPALLIDLGRVDANLHRMLEIAGGPQRLRPHVKTHKMAELVRRQIDLGIHRFKCATLAEAEMTAAAGASDILLAYQPVGPNQRRWVELAAAFPNSRFSTLVDDPQIIADLDRLGRQRHQPLDVFLDLDIGQHRTGVPPGPPAAELAQTIHASHGLRFRGLHAYDGHLHQSDPAARSAASDSALAPVAALRQELTALDVPVPTLVAGGTPTFPFHAARPDPGIECSPGTCVLWDAGYAQGLPDLPFSPAAWLLTRVVSRPTPHRLCLDLGHKAVASEMPHPRALFPALPDARPVAHNEEHLVLETPEAHRWPVGSHLLALPWHICPTVALHAEAWILENNAPLQRWPVAARARRLRF